MNGGLTCFVADILRGGVAGAVGCLIGLPGREHLVAPLLRLHLAVGQRPQGAGDLVGDAVHVGQIDVCRHCVQLNNTNKKKLKYCIITISNLKWDYAKHEA